MHEVLEPFPKVIVVGEREAHDVLPAALDGQGA